jgi:hypothetical protein
MPHKMQKSEYRKLRRFEAYLLADFARQNKKMDLPSGWLSFYRLTPAEINRRFPVLSVEEIVKEARLIDVAVEK